jgi:hypothetical protein
MVQNSDISCIEVSKLCCPTCKQLLEILRNGEDIFSVRGFHSTFSPVELPPWLPSDQVQGMVDRFSGILLTEVSTFMNKVTTSASGATIGRRIHTPSQSTESDASFSSGSESTASIPSVTGMRRGGFTTVPWKGQWATTTTVVEDD